MNHIVVSFVSPDKPGLVDTLSNIVNKYQGNWQASSMHTLSGYFAGTFEVALSENNTNDFISDIDAIEDLEAICKVAEATTDSDSVAVILELTANDRSGIIQEISSVIHKQGGNLLKLVSKQESAAHTGQKLFKARATIDVRDRSTDDLIDALENLADDLMVDISR